LFPEILDLKKSSIKKVGLNCSLETNFLKIGLVKFFSRRSDSKKIILKKNKKYLHL
jgi:hypothetical protein